MAEDAAIPNHPEHSQRTNEAAIESNWPECSDSSIKNPDTSGISSAADDNDNEKSLDFANELMEKGSIAFKEGDYSEAAELFSRALEIRCSCIRVFCPFLCFTNFFWFCVVM